MTGVGQSHIPPANRTGLRYNGAASSQRTSSLEGRTRFEHDRRFGGVQGRGSWPGGCRLPRSQAGAGGWEVALLSGTRMGLPAQRREEVQQRAEGHVSGDVGQVGIVPARLRDEPEAGDRRKAAADDHGQLTASGPACVDGDAELDRAGDRRPRAEARQRRAGVRAEAGHGDRDDRRCADGGVDAEDVSRCAVVPLPGDGGDHVDQWV